MVIVLTKLYNMENYSDVLFYGVLIISLFAMLFTFGALIINERGLFVADINNSKINLQELNEYFLLKGLVVKYLCPISNSNKWFAILQKDGCVRITIISKKEGKLYIDLD